MTENSKWYCASLVYRCTVGDDDLEPFLEHRLILLQAHSLGEAEVSALKLAPEAEHDYENEARESVTWSFIKLLEIKELFDKVIGDGTAVYWTFMTEGEL